MKICTKCWAEYDDDEVTNDFDACIECYGECVEAKLVDKTEYMKSVNRESLQEKKQAIASAPISDHHKRVLLNRLEKLLKEKAQ